MGHYTASIPNGRQRRRGCSSPFEPFEGVLWEEFTAHRVCPGMGRSRWIVLSTISGGRIGVVGRRWRMASG